MKRFNFRFETVLNVRQLIEEQKKQALGKKLAEKKEYEEERARKLSELDSVLSGMKVATGDACDIETLLLKRRYVQKLKNDIHRIDMEIKKVEKEIESLKAEVAEAMKNRKVMDKLKEKKYAEYRKDFLKEEQVMLDEIGTKDIEKPVS